MFWVVQHKPTKTWMPKLSVYYTNGLIDWYKNQTIDPTWVKEFNFNKAFKYQNEDLAKGYTKVFVVHNNWSIDDFEIKGYDCYPLEFMEFINPYRNREFGNTKFHIKYGILHSNVGIYCDNCKILIGHEMPYLSMFNNVLCPLCFKDISDTILTKFNEYPNKEFLERMISLRFTEMLKNK
jgi:hypothetical protein